MRFDQVLVGPTRADLETLRAIFRACGKPWRWPAPFHSPPLAIAAERQMLIAQAALNPARACATGRTACLARQRRQPCHCRRAGAMPRWHVCATSSVRAFLVLPTVHGRERSGTRTGACRQHRASGRRPDGGGDMVPADGASARRCIPTEARSNTPKRLTPARCLQLTLGTTPVQRGRSLGRRCRSRPGSNSRAANFRSPCNPPRRFDVRQPLAGLLIDEWVEVVPSTTETTGIALQYDQPNAAPPQTILVAVPPDLAAPWTIWSLQQVLLETLDLARIRAVDPDALAKSGTICRRCTLLQHRRRHGFDRLHALSKSQDAMPPIIHAFDHQLDAARTAHAATPR